MSGALRLSIPEPCHEKWKDMTPNEQGRHCMACQKTVVDFSVMSDKEILEYITQANGNVCGRFDKHQLNRGLKENKLRKRSSLMYMWQLVVMLLLLAGKTKAQGGVRAHKVSKEKRKSDKRVVEKECTQKLVGMVLSKIDTTTPIEPLPDTTAMIGSEVKVDTLPIEFTQKLIAEDLSIDTSYAFDTSYIINGSINHIASMGIANAKQLAGRHILAATHGGNNTRYLQQKTCASINLRLTITVSWFLYGPRENGDRYSFPIGTKKGPERVGAH